MLLELIFFSKRRIKNPEIIKAQAVYQYSAKYITKYLKRRGVESAMMRFPAESHELSRSGQPVHRKQRFEAIINWHKKHLT